MGFREGQFDGLFFFSLFLHPLWIWMSRRRAEKYEMLFLHLLLLLPGRYSASPLCSLACPEPLLTRSLSVITSSSCKLPEKLQAVHAIIHSFICLSIYFGGSEVPGGTGGQKDSQGSSLSRHH